MNNTAWYTQVEALASIEDTISARVTVSADSPWFDGHFPDDPILPGIAQLSMVADLVSGTDAKGMVMGNLSRVKFKKIVRPGVLLDISVTKGNKKGHYMFRITSDGDEVCSGMMRF